YIGEVRDGKPVLTTPNETLLKEYNAFLLKNAGIDGQFTKVELKSYDGTYYFLVYTGSKYKSHLLIKIDGNRVSTAGVSCTTSDWASETHGCVPKPGTGPDAGSIYCTPCSNNGKCIKTVTVAM
ncbi:MAG: hypothetical protein N2747_02525, partial [Chitinophagaceae bacterium]|nr:hypothetical protein [Chitinophagaceae bacterium]